MSAIVLFSGGLDSQLAACLLKNQGISVTGIVFESPFFGVDKAEDAAAALDIPLIRRSFTADIVSLLNRPKHGFGGNMNPCIDCHALMLRRAGEIMEDSGARFLATGEVLNERPMSQNMRSLKTVAAESGYADLVVRPLSARLLPETRPERLGWVDRNLLMAIEGRNRRAQLDLARAYNLRNYPAPAGGCRLTEPNFSRRLKDLRDHEGLNGTRSLDLLRIGRHFRLGDGIKVIVGRDENDNAVLEGTAELYDVVLKVENVPGPVAIISISATDDQKRMAASICARYSDCPRGVEAPVKLRASTGTSRVTVAPADPEYVESIRV